MEQYLISGIFIFVFFLYGVSIERFLFNSYSTVKALVSGFMGVNASFFLFTYIFRALELSFSLLSVVYSLFFIAALVLGIVVLLTKATWKRYLQSVAEFFREERKLKSIFILLICVLFLFSFSMTLRERVDSDDSYYMARAMEIIKTDDLGFSQSVAWLGWDCEYFNENTDASTLETLYAYISVLTGVPVAVLCRKAIALSISVVICCTIYILGCSFFRNEHHECSALLMLVSYLTLCIIYNSVFDSVAYRQIMSPWHGKAIVAAIIFPAIFSVCVEIYERGDVINWADWIYLAIIITASISASIIGVNFTVVYCVVMAAPLLIYRLIKKHTIKQYFMPCVVAMLPAIIFSGIALLTVITSNPDYFEWDYPNWSNAFTKSFIAGSHGILFVLFIISLLYFLVRGSTNQKLIIVGTTVFLFATFLNPLLLKPVSKFITTSSVYWRLYWIFPVWIAIPAAISDVVFYNGIGNAKLIMKTLLCTLISLFLIIFSYYGKVFSGNLQALFLNWYPSRLNPYALNEKTVVCADFIMNDSDEELPLLLDLTPRNNGGTGELFAIRQYTAEVGLCVGVRDNQVKQRTDIVPGTDVSVADFVIDSSYSDSKIDEDLLRKALVHLKADYVFAPDVLISENDFMEKTLTDGGNTLWRVVLP